LIYYLEILYPGSAKTVAMHEYSLAMEVITVAEQVAEQKKAVSVDEITIEIGNMSGVEAEVFESALRVLAENSVLEKAKLNIVRLKGKGVCLSCKKDYEMNRRMDTCPECHTLPAEIRGGKEFRVVSLLIEEKD
jgi:hydrogenase nickel incorporation protein HypA/HybF